MPTGILPFCSVSGDILSKFAIFFLMITRVRLLLPSGRGKRYDYQLAAQQMDGLFSAGGLSRPRRPLERIKHTAGALQRQTVFRKFPQVRYRPRRVARSNCSRCSPASAFLPARLWMVLP